MSNYTHVSDGKTEAKKYQSKAVLHVEFQLASSLIFLFYPIIFPFYSACFLSLESTWLPTLECLKLNLYLGFESRKLKLLIRGTDWHEMIRSTTLKSYNVIKNNFKKTLFNLSILIDRIHWPWAVSPHLYPPIHMQSCCK